MKLPRKIIVLDTITSAWYCDRYILLSNFSLFLKGQGFKLLNNVGNVHNENICSNGAYRHLAHLGVPTFAMAYLLSKLNQNIKTTKTCLLIHDRLLPWVPRFYHIYWQMSRTNIISNILHEKTSLICLISLYYN